MVGMGFAAGIMLLISIFELIPESLSVISPISTLTVVFLGALIISLLNLLVPHTHFFKEKGRLKSPFLKSAYLIAFGLILHDFPEGFAMANSYRFSPNLGIFVAIAIALHNIPEEFAIASPLVASGSKKSTLFKTAFISGLAEPFGAILGLFAVNFFSYLNPYFMAFAAGAMIFISIHELSPIAKACKKPMLFTTGMILSIVIYLALNLIIPE
jgi:ZIP family zinc transporter